MDFQHIDNIDDPRLALYRNLKDAELAAQGDRFVVEGHFVVQRVLASDFPVDSILIADRKIEEMRSFLRDGIPIYLIPDSMVNHLVGFQFHTGVMAIARRLRPRNLDQIISTLGPRATLVVLPETSSLQNMGSLIRVSAAFGVDAILIGPQSVDPFYRLPIRVSMGTCFKLPILRCQDLAADLIRLREQWGLQLFATVLDDRAEVLGQFPVTGRSALLFGGEGYGLSPQWLALCDRKVTIPMKLGTDSLNVAVSAGVFLWHFTT